MLDLEMFIYTEIDVFCMILILYLCYKSRKSFERRSSASFYLFTLIFAEIVVVLDLIWHFMSHGVLPNRTPYNFLVQHTYFVVAVGISELWFIYTMHELESKLIHKQGFLAVVSLPFLAVIVLLLESAFNGVVFHFTGDGGYERGKYAFIPFYVSCGYLLLAAVHAVIAAFMRKNYLNRRKFLSLGSFALVTAASYMGQFVLMGTPMPCVGLTVALLMVYLASLERMVSLDSLTRLNNRTQLLHFLKRKTEQLSDKKGLYLIMLDMDKFKSINDNFGHIEGDRALQELSRVLKLTAARFNCFIARYGGDEFVIVHETKTEADMEDIRRYIESLLEPHNASAHYQMRISMGYAKYSAEYAFLPDFIDCADRALYEVKRAKKRAERVYSEQLAVSSEQ